MFCFGSAVVVVALGKGDSNAPSLSRSKATDLFHETPGRSSHLLDGILVFPRIKIRRYKIYQTYGFPLQKAVDLPEGKLYLSGGAGMNVVAARAGHGTCRPAGASALSYAIYIPGLTPGATNILPRWGEAFDAQAVAMNRQRKGG